MFEPGKSSFKGTLAGGVNDCTSLLGPSALAGTITIKWKANITPNTTTVTLGAGSSVGGLFASPWGGTYGQFTLGTPEGAALSATGAFTGGDGGAASHSVLVTTQDISSILGSCGAKGLKTINIGVGQLKNG